MGAAWDGCYDQIERAGYSSSPALALAAFLHAHPSIPARVGIPSAIVDLLRMWVFSTWIVSEAGQSFAWRPHTGVPQGHNLAALVFRIFYLEIMQEVDRRLLVAQVGVVLPRCEGRSLVQCSPPSECLVGAVAFRDDFALAIMDEDSSALLKKLAHVADIAAAVHAEFHLKLN
eukprot:252196-Amphidinium_carterae.1